MKFITGEKQLPTIGKMTEDKDYHAIVRILEGYPEEKPHLLAAGQINYYKDLANTAEIEGIPEIITDVFKDANLNNKLSHDFRNYRYIISDDLKTFSRVIEGSSEYNSSLSEVEDVSTLGNSPSFENLMKQKID